MLFWYSFLPIILLIPTTVTSDLPLAPYNVKLFCRQGVRFSRVAQTAVQCPSASTACAFIEFTSPDKNGFDKTGVYDCVDSGILAPNESAEEEEATSSTSLFSEICGATPQCSSLNMNALNPDFAKYLITTHGIEIEKMRNSTLRFCCSLFHSTLQKLVSSGNDKLPSVSAPPVHCGTEVCSAGAVGCLLHSQTTDDYDYKIKRKRRYTEDDEYVINAVELTFDYEDYPFEIVTKSPRVKLTTTAVSLLDDVKIEEEEESILSTPSTAVTSTTTVLPSLSLPDNTPATKTKNGVKYAVVDEYDDYDNYEDEMHCVYRHLNNEHYRYCLLVHQRKNGDRCYHHQGHIICCCFVPPDRETCDPTVMDLVVPPPSPTRAPIIRVTHTVPRATILPTSTSSSTTSSTTTSTSTSTTTTTTETPTSPPTTVPPYQRRCRITYPRSRTKGRKGRPLLVCDSSNHLFSSTSLSLLFLHVLYWFC